VLADDCTCSSNHLNAFTNLVQRIHKPPQPTPKQAKRILGDVNFMRSLEEFDKDNIPEGVIKRLRRYIDDPTYTPGVQRGG